MLPDVDHMDIGARQESDSEIPLYDDPMKINSAAIACVRRMRCRVSGGNNAAGPFDWEMIRGVD